MAEFINKWKEALKSSSKPQVPSVPSVPDIETIKGSLDTTFESLNLPARIKQIEEWQQKFADPNIRENIFNLEQRYKDIVALYNSLKSAADNLANEASAMAQPINNMISYIGYLNTDLDEIKEALRIGWWKLPDPIAAAIHVGEAIYHMIVINNYLKQILTGFKDRLFTSMAKNLGTTVSSQPIKVTKTEVEGVKSTTTTQEKAWWLPSGIK